MREVMRKALSPLTKPFNDDESRPEDTGNGADD
jgi:hypothetical protein